MTDLSQLPDHAPLTHRVMVALDVERRRRAPEEARVPARVLAATLGVPAAQVTGALCVLRECGDVTSSGARPRAWELSEAGIRGVPYVREDAERRRTSADASAAGAPHSTPGGGARRSQSLSHMFWHRIAPGIMESEDFQHRLVLTQVPGPRGGRRRFWAHAEPDRNGAWTLQPRIGARTCTEAKLVVHDLLSRGAPKTGRPQSSEDGDIGHAAVLILDAERRKRAPNQATMLARDLAAKVNAPVPDVTAALRVLRKCGHVSVSGRPGQWGLTDKGVGLAAWIRETARTRAARRRLELVPAAQ